MTTHFLSVREVAERYGVSTDWVRAHSRGERRPVLPALRMGRAWRFSLESLEAWERALESERQGIRMVAA